MIGVVASILTAVVCVLLWIWRRSKNAPLRKIPHVSGGWPVLGNALQMDSARPHHTIGAWARDLGAVFVFKVLGKSHVVVNSPEALYEILVLRGDDYAGRPYMYRADYSFCGCQNVAFQTVTPQWRLLRKEVHRSVKQFGAGMDRLETIALDALNDLCDHIDSHGQQAFDPRQYIYEAFTNIMCTLILGRRLRPDDPMLPQVITMERLYCDGFQGAGDGLLLDILPVVRYLGNKSYKILTQAMETRDKLWGSYLPDLKGSLVRGEERGIADALLAAQEDEMQTTGGKQILTDDSIKMALTDVINGGTVTTSSTLYGFINILLHYPEVQDRLHEEIISVKMQNKQNFLTLVNKTEMPYARATLLELLRYTTIGALGLPHETVADTQVAGYHIPKGTFVMPNLWAAHHDPEHWEEPWEFRPERFLDEGGLMLAPDHPRRKWFMPFGAGPRVCLGEPLALNRLFLAIVVLCQRFCFLPDPDKTTSCDPRTYEFGGLLKPLSYSVRVKRWEEVDRK